MKRFLLDTCCISELIKKKPNSKVVQWFEEEEELRMYLSVLTLGELRKGIEKLPSSKKKRDLNRWFTEDLIPRFDNRVIEISFYEIEKWAEITAQTESQGKPLPAIDGLIAASALAHNLVLVTRNTKDFEETEVELLNIWG